MQKKPTLRSQSTAFFQLCQLIPPFLCTKLSKELGVDKKARTFTPWSHVVSMIFGQMTHAIGLNDVCDALRLHAPKLSVLRGAVPPHRNTLSHANSIRDAKLIKKLFWGTLKHLENIQPCFGLNRHRKGVPRRFKATIHAVDSSTIQLIARCMDWAKHRKRKAAAKLHLRISVADMMPRFALIMEAKPHDNTQARELCAGIRPGEIVVFDKAYVDYKHLNELNARGVFWVVRAKDTMRARVWRKKQRGKKGRILRDDLIHLSGKKSRDAYPEAFRRVVAEVCVDGQWIEMTFITNNLEWAASSVAELYAARWSIEVFFKQLKQVLRLQGFLGTSANAIAWQVWSALLVYVLLRFMAFASGWGHSFTRLFTLLRGILWDRWDAVALLKSYGTAGGGFERLYAPRMQYLPGFKSFSVGQQAAS